MKTRNNVEKWKRKEREGFYLARKAQTTCLFYREIQNTIAQRTLKLIKSDYNLIKTHFLWAGYDFNVQQSHSSEQKRNIASLISLINLTNVRAPRGESRGSDRNRCKNSQKKHDWGENLAQQWADVHVIDT